MLHTLVEMEQHPLVQLPLGQVVEVQVMEHQVITEQSLLVVVVQIHAQLLELQQQVRPIMEVQVVKVLEGV